MKATAKELLRAIQSPWGLSLVITLSAIALLFLLYYNTITFMVSTWRNSNNYEHCFFIVPICIYMISKHRSTLALFTPYPDYLAIVVLALLGFIWQISYFSDVMVVQQYMVVAMIPTLVWAFMGRRIVFEIAFPLGFMFFAVPFGDFLIPGLMSFTADFTVALLTVTGIPVLRDGFYFSIPSGDWSVVEACSGIRYLIASLTLGSLFAYINYYSYLKRFIFILMALIVPVIANGLRAYLIVMIGHLSSMTLAVGVDHFIYGWVFFGLVMALMFWVGSKWSDPVATSAVNSYLVSSHVEWRKSRLLMAAVGVLLVISFWPMLTNYLERAAAYQLQLHYNMSPPQIKSPWRQIPRFTDWVPHYIGADAEQQAYYINGKYKIALFLRYYKREGQGHELVSYQNKLITRENILWKLPEEKHLQITVNGQTFDVMQGRLLSERQELVTLRWNWIAGYNTSNDWLAKLYQAYHKLIGNPTDQAGIILAVEVDGNPTEAKQAMLQFISTNLPAIEQSIREVTSLVPQ